MPDEVKKVVETEAPKKDALQEIHKTVDALAKALQTGYKGKRVDAAVNYLAYAGVQLDKFRKERAEKEEAAKAKS